MRTCVWSSLLNSLAGKKEGGGYCTHLCAMWWLTQWVHWLWRRRHLAVRRRGIIACSALSLAVHSGHSICWNTSILLLCLLGLLLRLVQLLLLQLLRFQLLRLRLSALCIISFYIFTIVVKYLAPKPRWRTRTRAAMPLQSKGSSKAPSALHLPTGNRTSSSICSPFSAITGKYQSTQVFTASLALLLLG